MPLLTGRQALLVRTGRLDGLGNRVRALLSAQALAEAEERDLYYVWSTGKSFGPRMEDLWVFRAGRRVPRLVSAVLAVRAPFRPPSDVLLGPELRREHLWQIRSHGLPVTWEDPGWQGQADDAARAAGWGGASVPRPWGYYLRELTPVDPVAEVVRSFYDTHLRGRPYVGVQVRTHRVSHTRTLCSSPLEWFVQRMHQIRSEHPEAAFFLSCDTREGQDRLMEEFDGCLALEGKGGYNTTQGVRSAVADLYLLASAQHLVGAAHSSFVEMAVLLCDGLVPFERPGQPLEGQVDLSLGGAVDPLRPARRADSQTAI
ncbi:hypothetical protein D4740_12345 [Actinomyces sp. 2119]|uniref:Uncharacterized protein n=1 Tax=Actinomyces lilanjuaniae TaxID=2321394 RepID=A0ABM6Z5D0_9ACTO|nr:MULTISPECIES: hypothetical protein [Actinomyces]AYD90420.1 hypothetical protein D5R93_11155 [Actinomyces lilanjuaniae]RJF40312.1 hypothetical protein D4740_12345 [Actinomyces sp. 2119]